MSKCAKWTIGGVVTIGIAIALVLIFIPHISEDPNTIPDGVSIKAKWIMLDAKNYEILWMRWTVVDWILGLVAAGTAITTAVKNAFTSHSQAAAAAGGAAAPAPGKSSVNIDRAVMVFAGLAVVATTLDARCMQLRQQNDIVKEICFFRMRSWTIV